MRISNIFNLEGSNEADILVVCDPISEVAHYNGKVLTDEALNLFMRTVTSFGIKSRRFCFLNACSPISEEIKYSDSKVMKQIKEEHEEFLSVVKKIKYKCIILLGKYAIKQYYNKNVNLNKRLSSFEACLYKPAICFASHSPEGVLMFPDTYPIFKSDILWLSNVINNNFDYNVTAKFDYKWCTDLTELLENRPKYLAVDTETTGLQWYNDAIVPLTVQLTPRVGLSYVVPVNTHFWDFGGSKRAQREKKDIVVAQLKELLEDANIKKIGHNFKFDDHIISKLDITVANWHHDTLQLAKCVDENMTRVNLDACVKRWLPSLAGYCVDGEVEILSSDFTKVKAKNIKKGDVLVGFDEFPIKRNFRRRMKKAIVLEVKKIIKPRYRIKTSQGRDFIVSDNHMFLTKTGKGSHWKWREVEKMSVGSGLKRFPFADFDYTYAGGYLAGLLDGEGWLQNTGDGKQSLRIGFSQKEGSVLSEYIKLMEEKVTDKVKVARDKRKGSKVYNVTIGNWFTLKILQMFRPKRLLEKEKWVGVCIPDCKEEEKRDYIIEKEYIGYGEVYAITTDTHTFVAEGICSHNSDAFNLSVDKGDMINVPKDDFLYYAGGDTDATFRLCSVLVKEAQKEPSNYKCYREIQMPALITFSRSHETYGIKVDEEAFDAFEKFVNDKMKVDYVEVIKKVPTVLLQKHEKKGLKFSRGDFVRDILFSKEGYGLTPQMYTKSTKKLSKEEDRVPSTSQDHMQYFIGNEFVNAYLPYNKLDTIRKNFIKSYRKHLYNSELHPSYLLSTSTGRSNSMNPNGQNFPKRGDYVTEYRKSFVAREGYKLLGADYSQAELRLIAWEAREPTMLKVYREGGDLHLKTVEEVVGIPIDKYNSLDKNEKNRYRTIAKAINFGLAYSQGPKGFQVYAKTSYGLEMTLEEAENYINMFFKKYNLRPWQENIKRKARENGKVYSMHGAVRRLPNVFSNNSFIQGEAERQGINFGIQRLASDMGLIAFSRILRDVDFEVMRSIMYVHDSIVMEVKEEYFDEMSQALKWYMEDTSFLEERFGLKPPIPIIADVEAGYNLGEMEEIEVISKKPEWYGCNINKKLI